MEEITYSVDAQYFIPAICFEFIEGSTLYETVTNADLKQHSKKKEESQKEVLQSTVWITKPSKSRNSHEKSKRAFKKTSSLW